MTVTVDALHTQRQTAQQIVEKKAAYLMTVKANQPTLLADIETLFNHPTYLPDDCAKCSASPKHAVA